MAEVLYLNEEDLSDLVRKKFRAESVTFGHDEKFLHDEPEGTMVAMEGINGEESEDQFRYLDLFHLIIEYVESLDFEFCGWRLFTIYEGFGAVILVKRRQECSSR